MPKASACVVLRGRDACGCYFCYFIRGRDAEGRLRLLPLRAIFTVAQKPRSRDAEGIGVRYETVFFPVLPQGIAFVAVMPKASAFVPRSPAETLP